MRPIFVLCASLLLVSTGTAQEAKEKPRKLINVNAATQAELEKLPGIGPVKAKAIIDARELAPIRDASDLDQRVKGFGPATIAKIKDLISFDVEPREVTLIGSTRSQEYHRRECPKALRLPVANAVWFEDAEDAAQNGYAPAPRCCNPPAPPQGANQGQPGGPALQPPGMNPPRPVPGRALPPRLPAGQQPAANQWTGIAAQQELAAREDWDTWAKWYFDRWCERWHVTKQGLIARSVGYPAAVELKLMSRFKEMKSVIGDNEIRIKELRGTSKSSQKSKI